MLTDYLAAEALIIARLREQVHGAKAVLGAADLAGVAESKQQTPALHVLFRGYRPTRTSGEGRVQETEQTWQVVVAVKNLRSPQTGTHAREEAGPLLAAVLAALQGWSPSTEHTALRLAPGAAPGFHRGYAYFPLAFVTHIVTRATP